MPCMFVLFRRMGAPSTTVVVATTRRGRSRWQCAATGQPTRLPTSRPIGRLVHRDNFCWNSIRFERANISAQSPSPDPETRQLAIARPGGTGCPSIHSSSHRNLIDIDECLDGVARGEGFHVQRRILVGGEVGRLGLRGIQETQASGRGRQRMMACRLDQIAGRAHPRVHRNRVLSSSRTVLDLLPKLIGKRSPSAADALKKRHAPACC